MPNLMFVVRCSTEYINRLARAVFIVARHAYELGRNGVSFKELHPPPLLPVTACTVACEVNDEEWIASARERLSHRWAQQNTDAVELPPHAVLRMSRADIDVAARATFAIAAHAFVLGRTGAPLEELLPPRFLPPPENMLRPGVNEAEWIVYYRELFFLVFGLDDPSALARMTASRASS